ncbi:DUF2264 domain-containing protein [Dactylosporangium sp. NPDC051541]|uniref:DUF2264 domain-containing protein n=1 Tax=Dactylosporangium sp. NPDC051541 TaxID=3363977 RepID=UPI00379DB9BE
MPGAEWSRADWTAFADGLLAGARRHASPGHALITPPGPEGGYGRAVDGLEGFARTFLLAGFRIAGDRGEGPVATELLEWYSTGLANGVDPDSSERWVRLREHGQAKVEAASIALMLDLTRDWLWSRLDLSVRQRVVEYLAPAVGDKTYPRINWVWFRLVVETFLRSVDGPWSADDVAEDLATHDTFRRADGWLADGADRAYDHYTGWALHLYPTLWARMAGAAELAAGRIERDRADLDRYLTDAIELVGADGSPLLQGRSLIYRFAAAAPFWVGGLAGVPSLGPGRLRHAAERIVRHFADRGAPGPDGLLSVGWHAPWPRLAQAYSGPASPYWASKGLLGIALPADDPLWTAPAEPLPIEERDTLRAIVAPGWLVAGTRSDGVVRVVNHGTDHDVEGSGKGDSPLYARLGYSTATAPVLDEAGWTDPLDQSVVLVDRDGNHAHRAGLTTLDIRLDGTAGIAGSRSAAHWVEAEPGQRDHGSGRAGRSRPAGDITVWSIVRGPWEVRLIRVERPAADAVKLRVGGWPVTGDALVSTLLNLTAAATPVSGVAVHPDGGPLGGAARTPWLEYPVRPGRWLIALVELSATPAPKQCTVTLDDSGETLQLRVTWPDGTDTPHPITLKEKG